MKCEQRKNEVNRRRAKLTRQERVNRERTRSVIGYLDMMMTKVIQGSYSRLQRWQEAKLEQDQTQSKEPRTESRKAACPMPIVQCRQQTSKVET